MLIAIIYTTAQKYKVSYADVLNVVIQKESHLSLHLTVEGQKNKIFLYDVMFTDMSINSVFFFIEQY